MFVVMHKRTLSFPATYREEGGGYTLEVVSKVTDAVRRVTRGHFKEIGKPTLFSPIMKEITTEIDDEAGRNFKVRQITLAWQQVPDILTLEEEPQDAAARVEMWLEFVEPRIYLAIIIWVQASA